MKLIKIILLSIISNLCNAQESGVIFFEGNWDSLLQKAKIENKPIYVDFFTEWCGPCKMMDKQFFPIKEVGDVMNPNFIAFHIDAEKGEGLELAKKYSINVYPTSIFVTSEGLIFHRIIGYPGLKKGIEEIKIAKKIFDETASKSIEDLDKEFEIGNRNFEFVSKYFKRKVAANIDITEIKDKYFQSLNENDLKNTEILKFLVSSPVEVDTKLYDFLIQKIRTNPTGLPLETQNSFINGIKNTESKAIKNNNFELLLKTNKANDEIGSFLIEYLKIKKIQDSEIEVIKERIAIENNERILNFYEKTSNIIDLNKYIVDQSKLLQINANELKSKDLIYYNAFLERSKNVPETQKHTSYFKNYARQQTNFFTNKSTSMLTRFAKSYFATANDKKSLKKAIKLVQIANNLAENEDQFKLLSDIFLKMNCKEKAITSLQKAISINPENNDLKIELDKISKK